MAGSKCRWILSVPRPARLASLAGPARRSLGEGGFPPFAVAVVTPHSLARPRPVPWQAALVTPFPALLYGHGCPQVFGSPACPPLAGSPSPVPCSRFPVPAFAPGHRCPQVSGAPFPVPGSPLLGVIHNGVWPFVHVKTIKFGSKSIKKATFSVKKGSKRRAFRHAHLNILGCHPLWR